MYNYAYVRVHVCVRFKNPFHSMGGTLHTQTHVHIYTHMHTHIHTYIHIYTHTHTYTFSSILVCDFS